MRIWDVHPGYLNRQSLLGEHRELHGLVNVLTQGKKGYSKHPETLRWVGYGWALKQRHTLLAAEMALRGYQDKSPVLTRSSKGKWPHIFIDEPLVQFQILAEKYKDKELGRIPLPRNARQLWSHHKYSVMARDQKLYKSIGQHIANHKNKDDLVRLALELTQVLRTQPTSGGVMNALQHMWGYVSEVPSSKQANYYHKTPKRLLLEIQRRTIETEQRYLLHSTALSELAIFINKA